MLISFCKQRLEEHLLPGCILAPVSGNVHTMALAVDLRCDRQLGGNFQLDLRKGRIEFHQGSLVALQEVIKCASIFFNSEMDVTSEWRDDKKCKKPDSKRKAIRVDFAGMPSFSVYTDSGKSSSSSSCKVTAVPRFHHRTAFFLSSSGSACHKGQEKSKHPYRPYPAWRERTDKMSRDVVTTGKCDR